jgi:hypothetical protein
MHCFAEANDDPARRDQWLRQAEKWTALARKRTGRVAVSWESNDAEHIGRIASRLARGAGC